MPESKIVLQSIEWFRIPGFILLLCISLWFLWKSGTGVSLFFRFNRRIAAVPRVLIRSTMFTLTVWVALTVGSSWVTWLYASDTFFSYNQVGISQGHIAFYYQYPKRKIEVKWKEISHAGLIKQGTTTAILEVERLNGERLKSVRTDRHLLNQVLSDINTHERR